MRHRRALPGLLAAVTAACGVVEPGAAAVPPAAPTTGLRLLSGDVVTLGGPQGAQVRAAEGREHVTFRISQDERGNTHVVPEDAIVPLAQGKLDPALFDVTELARSGHGDTLPLIVAGPTPRGAGARVTRELPVLGAVAVDADRSGAYWATLRTAERVWLDEPVRTGDRLKAALMGTAKPTKLQQAAGRVDAADGLYTGTLTATGDGRSARTPVAIHREVESHTVTLKVIDHSGAPTNQYSARFTNVAPEPHHPTTYQPYDASGTVTVRLPKGEYFFDATVLQPIGDKDYRNAEFAEPAFVVSADTELVIDAREAKPVSMTTDKPNARPGKGSVLFVRDTASGEVGVQASGQRSAYEAMTVKPSTTRSDAFRFTAEAHLAEWTGTSFDGSPYLYHLRHSASGVVPAMLEWVDHDRDLAEVRSEHASTTPGTIGERDHFMRFPLPGTLTEHYTPAVEWRYGLEFTEDDRHGTVTSSRRIAPLSFERGRVAKMRWGVGVFSPAAPTAYYLESADTAGRWPGDVLRFSLPLVSDQDPGRVGHIRGTGHTKLLRDGAVVGEHDVPGEGWFPVGPERAEYSLRTFGDRSSFARLSTQVGAEWTFTSEHVTETVALPLLVLRFAPNLDNTNAAPAGRRFTIPLYLQRNGSDAPGAALRPSVEVSYDDGATWRPAPVSRHHDRWTATVDHPADAKFVSLRSSVSDPDGNTQRQTIIRAYALR